MISRSLILQILQLRKSCEGFFMKHLRKSCEIIQQARPTLLALAIECAITHPQHLYCFRSEKSGFKKITSEMINF